MMRDRALYHDGCCRPGRRPAMKSDRHWDFVPLFDILIEVLARK